MNIIIYIVIFLSKVLENSLATLRLIVVANGKKFLGAVLLCATSIVWIAVTGLVIIDITKDPIKVLFFAVGSFVGSYTGSLIEEKIALGNNLLTVITNKKSGEVIAKELRHNNYAVTSICGNGRDDEKLILLIMIPRKKVEKVVDIIINVDDSSMIVEGNAVNINGGYNGRTQYN